MNMFGRIVGIVGVVCGLLLSPFTLCGVAQAENAPLLQSGRFETDNSFLTYEQYEMLGFVGLGSAASQDLDPTAHPLQDYNDPSLTYTGNVEYGWSNPQVLSVMLSSPYWDELNYGADMGAAGSTKYTVTSGVDIGGTLGYDITLSTSFSVAARATAVGNGAGAGFDVGAAAGFAQTVQRNKTQSTSFTFEAGAGDDHVAMVVFPMAVYQYEWTVNGEKQYVFATVQLTPVFAMQTLTNYNRVAKRYNLNTDSTHLVLPVFDMQDICPGYTPGDPTGCFSVEKGLPQGFTMINGAWMPSTVGDTPTADQIRGETLVSAYDYTVSLGNADTGAESSLEVSTAVGVSGEVHVALSGSVYGEAIGGFDLFGFNGEVAVRSTWGVECGVSLSTSRVISRGNAYSMEFIDLPSSAATGVTGQNIPKSDYAFQARLAVWMPTAKGENVAYAPCIISPLTEFSSAMPLYLPDDLHVSAVTRDSITLAWSNPEESPRLPDVYAVHMKSVGVTSAYSERTTVDAAAQSITIEGLTPNTTYEFALSARKGEQNGVIGPSVTVTTVGDGYPTVTKQPTDLVAKETERAEFSVEAVPFENGAKLTYQWYRLDEGRYGASWTKLIGQTSAVFNAAYYTADGTIGREDRETLDGTIYACLITEQRASGAVNINSNAVRLTIDNTYTIKNYKELRELALRVSLGDREAAKATYYLDNDIDAAAGVEWDVPIGSESVPFVGAFDGRGHTIRGLHYSGYDALGYHGLFGVVSDAELTRISLEQVNFNVQAASFGTICGMATNATTIRDCAVSGKINVINRTYAGGICGYAASGNVTVERCLVNAEMDTRVTYAGGICGFTRGDVRNVGVVGSLKAKNPASDGPDGDAPAGYAGGVCGYSKGTVSDSYCRADVAYGPHYRSNITNGAQSNCYYYTPTGNGSGNVRSAAAFESGQVAFELNNGVTDGTQPFYQDLDNGNTPQAYPVLVNNGDNTVYATEAGGYSNVQIIGSSPDRPQDDAVSSPPTGESDPMWLWMIGLTAISLLSVTLIGKRRKAKSY